MNDSHARSILEGPRWARSDEAIKDTCWRLGLTCVVDRDTSFLREKVRYYVSGEAKLVDRFNEWLASAVTDWNKN